jgi:hypothetical protein
VDARLASEKQDDEGGEEHHVARQPKEYEKANAMQSLARPSAAILIIVVAAAATTAGWASVYGRFPADSGLFAFDFRWGAREGDGHQGLCVEEITPTFDWTHEDSCEMVAF